MSILTHSKIYNTARRRLDVGGVPLAPMFALNALLFGGMGASSMLAAPGPVALVVMALAPVFLLLAVIGADWRTPGARPKPAKPAKVTDTAPAATIAVTAAGEAVDLKLDRPKLVLVQEPLADAGNVTVGIVLAGCLVAGPVVFMINAIAAAVTR